MTYKEKIQKAAEKGNPEAIHFPRPCLEEEGYSFSFSGLKSAVLNYLNQQEKQQRIGKQHKMQKQN